MFELAFPLKTPCFHLSVTKLVVSYARAALKQVNTLDLAKSALLPTLSLPG